MKKLSVIRKDDSDPCPFGLNIPFACQNAGNLIDKLAPLDALGSDATAEDKKQIQKANTRLFVWNSPCQQCKYAGRLIAQKNGVECNYGDTAAGVREAGVLLGSPFYSQIFAGIGIDGLYSYPLGFYGDYNISRNAYYGIYSLQGSKGTDTELRKLADEAYNAMISVSKK